MSRNVDPGVCVYGALALSKHLKDLRQEQDGARQGMDADAIHDLRVASRRFRDTLPLFRDCFPKNRFKTWKGAIRQMTRALGAARDLDVQLETLGQFLNAQADKAVQPGLRRLVLRLRQNRLDAQQGVVRALDAIGQQGVLDDVEGELKPLLNREGTTYLYTPALYTRSFSNIAQRLETFLSYEPYIDRPECSIELHAMRIAAKHLRYTLEVFAPIYPGELKEQIQMLRKDQDLLGEVHDADVWDLLLGDFVERERRFTLQFFGNLRGFRRLLPGIDCFSNDRRQLRQQKYQEFHELWVRQQDEHIWEKLAKTIQMPFFKAEPPSVAQAEEASGG